MAEDRVICVNLPVADLKKSTAFFLAIGLELYDECSSDEFSCLIVGEKAYVMLLPRPSFQEYIPGKSISDTQSAAEVIVNISAPDRRGVDEMIERAVNAGGAEYREAADFGSMYFRAFQDLDGHIWEVLTLEEAPTSVDIEGGSR